MTSQIKIECPITILENVLSTCPINKQGGVIDSINALTKHGFIKAKPDELAIEPLPSIEERDVIDITGKVVDKIQLSFLNGSEINITTGELEEQLR